MIKPLTGIALLALVACQVATGRGELVAFDNTSASSGNYAPGGATPSAGLMTTDAIYDDITVAPGAEGAGINDLSVLIFNNNAVDLTSATIHVRLYDTSGMNNGPGQEIGNVTGFGFFVPAGGSTLYDADFSSINITLFTVPTDGHFWVGIWFSNASIPDGTFTDITADELNNFGIGVFATPTIGTSDPAVALTGPADQPASASSLALPNSLPANFNVRFAVNAVPEPGTLALLLVGSVGSWGTLRRRRAA